MLKTTSQTEKDSFSIRFDDLNEGSLSELSFDEASEITGGFQVINDSGETRAFYNFGASVLAERQVLQPGETGDYDGEYILYNSSRTSFQPRLSPRLASDDFVSFRRQGSNTIVLNTSGIIALASAPLSPEF
ncbi:hypothetical protein [Nostoc sphaeroides]|uniref:Uncharacterized protein n=1 Tax=Nostoc sphaeroides CCNUC1 TaxID=2653204 RepID=A0A5P8VZ51_9NOSO|nr:hypothetical protein [Nostoc sphaeroides]MCC5629982.1 hypothetical protein [Nostoc sphaeroides CHAB 2801]QFS45712.1 hypothetical protein GXM_03189 [Nostoc sphaeroides CCNUC1]